MIITADTDRFFRELIEENEYRFLFEDLTVIDLGCNVGMFSLWIYRLAKQIYAIDISQENIENFNRIISDNKLTKIKTYILGIAEKTGTRPIIRNGEAGQGGWRLGYGAGEMPTLSLKEFMDREKIDHVDVLKIDIEGMETEVIDPDNFPKDRVSVIIGETHGTPIQDKLEEMGYRYYPYGVGLFVARK